MSRSASAFEHRPLEQMRIDDEPSFRHVGLYADLKAVLTRAKYEFRILPPSSALRADRALLLNLTYWTAQAGGDVMTEDRIDADVVAHVAWHHLAARALVPAAGAGAGARPSVDALLLGEAIASAFDVYLVGRLLGHSPGSSFLESQVPAMADAALEAGLDDDAFEALLGTLADDPDRAFSSLRELLFDASRALFEANDSEEALAALARFDAHPMASLLHRYELSNWVLYARAYGDPAPDTQARAADRAMREPGVVALDWLEARWVRPALTRDPP